jgi:hypothetical protein
MLRSFLPMVITGAGMWLNARYLPGLWAANFLIGVVLGLSSVWLSARLFPTPPAPVLPFRDQPLEIPARPLQVLGAVIVAAALFLLWRFMQEGSFLHFRPGLASMAVFAIGLAAGLGAFMLYAFRELASGR